MKIAIFPAAGGLGGATLSHLLHTAKVDPSSVVLVSRSPDKLDKEANSGAITRKGDFDDPDSLKGAFEGVDALNLISYPSFQHEHRVKVAKAAIDAAISQGVKHVFYSSLAFAREGEPTYKPHVMLAHLDTEAYLESLVSPTFSYTIIRQGLYTESYPIYTANFNLKEAQASADKELKIRIPHDGRGPGIPWAKRDELGEATANLIAEYDRDPNSFAFINKLIFFTGTKTHSLNDTAAIFSKTVEKNVRIESQSVEDYVVRIGVVPKSDSVELNRRWATAFEAIRHGEASTVTSHLKDYLGREPEGIEVTYRKMLQG
ncbi:uncharacterized protein IL334_006932 [Kwoniella shivajii]|uniref:NmrA-like domain-containing protein n=1 Tax=Kwoniella shivajii TaxID=564305 RepID=A0ABZ1D7C4_9TREE|nr:hypothetical protein IL334_006932 [Kwoniella shivajii]